MSRGRFAQFSKYRNSIGKPAKNEEAYMDLNVGTNSLAETSALVKASDKWVAFKPANGVGSIGLLPLQSVGRIADQVQVLNAHGAGITDWEFSPFDPQQLATAAENGEVKVWEISEKDNRLLATIATGTGKLIEAVVYHPTAHGLLTTVSGNLVQIWDISNCHDGSSLTVAKYTLAHPNVVNSVAWKPSGEVIATACKDSQIRIFDVRSQDRPIQAGVSHAGVRPIRVFWVGDKDTLMTIGFSKMREREIMVWNATDLSKPLNVKRMDVSSGLLIPLYDHDTSILYLASKGDNSLRWTEISETAPFFTDGISFPTLNPVAGACLVPKRVMNVMQTEIARILTITNNCIRPVSVSVPRKSLLDFHADLFPDTKSLHPGLEASEWIGGENKLGRRQSLDPGAEAIPVWARPAPEAPSAVPVTPGKTLPASNIATSQTPTTMSTPPPAVSAPPAAVATASSSTAPASPSVTMITEDTTKTATPVNLISVDTKPLVSNAPDAATSTPPTLPRASASPSSAPKTPAMAATLDSATLAPTSSTSTPVTPRSATFGRSPLAARLAGGQKTSKYRFLSFKPYHVSHHFESIHGLSISMPGECNMIEVNPKFVALPLHGSGGRIGILKTQEPGRVGPKIPSIICSSDLTSLAFDPFDDNKLVTASDDSKLKGWKIPEQGVDIEVDMTVPEWSLTTGAMDKISVILFHPAAKDVLLTASMDRDDPTVRLWDLKTQQEKVVIKGHHKGAIFSCAFNQEGTKIVTVCKDKKIRIFDARTGDLVQEGNGHQSLRCCRVVWLGATDFVASVGFGRSSQREILLFDSKDLSKGHIGSKLMDTSPGVLIPHFDADIHVLGISARGDRVMKHFELDLSIEEPASRNRFAEVANSEQGTLQQDVAYLPKRYCNVREVELMKMYRLTYNSVEVIGVSVPRNKKEYFQDELYPDTVDVETSTMTSEQFFSNPTATLPPRRRLNLCPSGMEVLSHHLAELAIAESANQNGMSSLDKFNASKEKAKEDDRKREAMERMFETAKESKSDRDTLVPDTGIIAEEEWDD